MFTSRAEYAIIYIYGYNLKPQRRILYDPSGPEPGSANEGVPCSDKSEGTACAAAVAAFRPERTVRRRTRLRTCVGDGCRHGSCHRRAGGRGNGMPDPALLPVPGTAHDALDADPAAAYQHGTAVHHRHACGTRHADGSAVRDRLFGPAAGSGGQNHADTARLHPSRRLRAFAAWA